MRINLREPRIKKIILASIAIAGAGYYYFAADALSFSYRARAKALAEKREKRDQLSLEVKRARASATQLAELRKESAQLEASWRKVESRLPSSLDSKELMSDITARGSRLSLQFLLVEPQNPRSLDFATEVPFSVRVLGQYHQLGRFLADLDNMPRILKLDALRIVPNPRAKEDKEVPPLIAEFEVSTFILGGASPIPAIPSHPGETGAVGASAGGTPKGGPGGAAKGAAKSTANAAAQPASATGAPRNAPRAGGSS